MSRPMSMTMSTTKTSHLMFPSRKAGTVSSGTASRFVVLNVGDRHRCCLFGAVCWLCSPRARWFVPSTTEAAARETGRFGRLLRSKSCERRVASFWDSKSPENPRYARFGCLLAPVPRQKCRERRCSPLYFMSALFPVGALWAWRRLFCVLAS